MIFWIWIESVEFVDDNMYVHVIQTTDLTWDLW